jgi:hypothetical protein
MSFLLKSRLYCGVFYGVEHARSVIPSVVKASNKESRAEELTWSKLLGRRGSSQVVVLVLWSTK